MLREKVFLSVPFYQTLPGVCISNTDNCSKDHDVSVIRRGEAYVDKNFSELWAMALNSRKSQGWTKFAMCHVDVDPLQDYWMDIAIEEQHRVKADLLGIVLPIKTDHGLTSTVVVDKNGRWKRLTKHELQTLPQTFDAQIAGYKDCELYVSTGLWICDFTKPWVEDVWFETKCRMIKEHDEFKIIHSPEDWNFSRMCHLKGLKVMGTKILQAHHWGIKPYDNYLSDGVECDDWHLSPDWATNPSTPIRRDML